MDNYLRQLPVGWKPKDGSAGTSPTVASADRTKADNVHWVLRRMAPAARILLFMHRDHLTCTLSTIRLPPT